jgi:hypothetical protein
MSHGFSVTRAASPGQQRHGLEARDPQILLDQAGDVDRLMRGDDMKFIGFLVGIWGLGLACAPLAAQSTQPSSSYARWTNGPSNDPSFFPIAVWLQDPRNAPRFKAAGFNVFVGLWQGPTEDQLAALKRAGMSVICEQNEVALKHLDDKTIIAWMHGDEPDNAQELPGKSGYGPPIAPEKIVADYQRIQKNDPTRPVMLNLGQGVAWDAWYGRGVRSNHPEDYPLYLQGCDIASFDIYPVVHDSPQVAGKLWFVPQGVSRLREWSHDEKIVWNCIECTRISNTKVKPTPAQVRSEVWMSIIAGSRGLIYFVHQFQPNFVEAALLQDAEMLSAVTKLNQQIHSLAPVLNRPNVEGVKVGRSNENVPLSAMVKRYQGATYVFAASLRDEPTNATIEIPIGAKNAEVLGENRSLIPTNGELRDSFEGYSVHIYRVASN